LTVLDPHRERGTCVDVLSLGKKGDVYFYCCRVALLLLCTLVMEFLVVFF